MMLQRKYNFAQYLKPILVGYSSGATLIYGILAQAPANTFKGAISLGFCPDIEINKPLCTGSGLKQHTLKDGHSYYLEAATNLTAPFIALHGVQDQVCPYAATEEYMKKVNTGHLIELPKVGHGFSVASSWLPQFIEAFKMVLNTQDFTGQKTVEDTPSTPKIPPLSGDFPIVPIPTAINDSLPLAFLISGDGGWTGFDYAIGKSLSDKGIPVIGLDAQKYFWKEKTPEETATEVAKAVQYYMHQWKRTKFILAGYSYGACVIPFIATRLPSTLQASLTGIYSLSPDLTVDFEVHITDMIGIGRAADSYRVPDEIRKLKPFHPVCIFGDGENAELRTRFGESGARIITIPGNHHYNANPAAPAAAIFKDVDAGLLR
jgi:type IV secretory pathway VirJ component